MSKIRIEYSNYSYKVCYITGKVNIYEIAVGDRHLTIEEHAQNFYELASALAPMSGVEVELVKV